MGNVLTITYNGSRSYRASSLFQYDYGQKLVLDGFPLPDVYEVHFSNTQKTGYTVTVLGDQEGVQIPDMCLLSGKEIYVWLYLHETDSDGETVYTTQIPVISRPYVTNTEPTPVQQNIITQAIAALKGAVEEATQAKEDAEAASQRAMEALEQVSEIMIQIERDVSAAEAAATSVIEAWEQFENAMSEQGIVFDEGRLEDIPADPDSGGGT